MSSPNCCFLTCIQISQEAGQEVWSSHRFKNFPQFVVIHTVKGFNVVNEADVFLEFSPFFDDPTDVDNLFSGFFAFSKSRLNIWKLLVHVLLKPVAAAKSLQSCPTLSDPMDGSLPGSSVHGIFQARVLSGVPLPSLTVEA